MNSYPRVQSNSASYLKDHFHGEDLMNTNSFTKKNLYGMTHKNIFNHTIKLSTESGPNIFIDL